MAWNQRLRYIHHGSFTNTKAGDIFKMETHLGGDDGSVCARNPCLVRVCAWTNDGMTREKSTCGLELLDPLLDLFSHCLVCAHERLLVDHDFGRIGFWTTDSGSDRRGVGLDDDAVNGNETGSCRV